MIGNTKVFKKKSVYKINVSQTDTIMVSINTLKLKVCYYKRFQLLRVYAGKCIVELIKVSLASMDTQREMGTNISPLLNVINNLGKIWYFFLKWK